MAAKIHHSVNGRGSLKTGNKAEFLVSKVLTDHGIENELMPLKHPFDIITKGGVRIDVKTAEKKFIPSGREDYGAYWRFGIRKDKKADCDFFVFYAKEINKFWVVPFDIFPNTNNAYIPCGNTKRSWSSTGIDFSEYENRFDLLS